jgi:hypothetical protein
MTNSDNWRRAKKNNTSPRNNHDERLTGPQSHQ